MTRAIPIVAIFASVIGAGPVTAQQAPGGRTAVFFERYTFADGLTFGGTSQLDAVSEWTIPVGVTVPLGRYVDLALSSGFARVHVERSGAEDLSISGALDTEARLSVQAVPGNLVVFVTGAIPTGVETVEQEELGVLSLLASDIVGFSATTLGTGGNVGGGFAGAIPVGRWAIGLGSTFREPLSFTPIVGQPGELKPGRELRLRAGLEGPLGQRSYMRIAGIVALRAKDELADSTSNGVGNRFMGYLSLDQGVGNTSLTIYVFDVFRADPRIEETALGAGVLPRSNLLASGARLAIPVAARTTLVPRVEFRNSWAAASDTDTDLSVAGRSFRFGADIRQGLHDRLALVLQGGGIVGFVRQLGDQQLGENVDLRGFRAALHLEVTP
jgi:hypothetical protein